MGESALHVDHVFDSVARRCVDIRITNTIHLVDRILVDLAFLMLISLEHKHVLDQVGNFLRTEPLENCFSMEIGISEDVCILANKILLEG